MLSQFITREAFTHFQNTLLVLQPHLCGIMKGNKYKEEEMEVFLSIEDLRTWADRLEEVQERLAPYA